MTALAPVPMWRDWVRRHERTLAAGWLVAVALLLLVLAIPRSRDAVLYRIQGLSDRWDARWTSRLARGDSLIAAGRNQEAVAYLERLDLVFPARNARHFRDKEREHLLSLLAKGYEALAKPGKAMATYNRLVSFDSLNYYNHYLRASAAERMLSGWAVAPEARDGFAGALVLFPNHLPSVRGHIRYYSDRSDWHPVVNFFHDYLNAFLIQHVTLRAGDSTLTLPVPVDGGPHPVTVTLGAGADAARFDAGGFPFAVDSVIVTAPVRVGVPAIVAATAVTAVPNAGLERTPENRYRPIADSGAVRAAFTHPAAGSTVRFVVRLFKPVDKALWFSVEQSHKNNMEHAEIPQDRARIVVFPDVASADAVIEHLPGSRDGLRPRAATP